MIRKGFHFAIIVTLTAVSFAALKNNRPAGPGHAVMQPLTSNDAKSNDGRPSILTPNHHAAVPGGYLSPAGQPRIVPVNNDFPHSVSPKPATVRSYLTSQSKPLAPHSHLATHLETPVQQPLICQSTSTPGQNQTIPHKFLTGSMVPQQSDIKPDFIQGTMSETTLDESPEAVADAENPIFALQRTTPVTTHETIASPTRDTALPVRKLATRPTKLAMMAPKPVTIDSTLPVGQATHDLAALHHNKARQSSLLAVTLETIAPPAQDTAVPVRKLATRPTKLSVMAPKPVTIDSTLPVGHATQDPKALDRTSAHRSSVAPWMQVFSIPGEDRNRIVSLAYLGQISYPDAINLTSYEKLVFVDSSVTAHSIDSLRPFFDHLKSPFLMIDISWLAQFINRLTQVQDCITNDQHQRKCKIKILKAMELRSIQQDEQPLDDTRKVLKNYQNAYQKITKEILQHQQVMRQHQEKKLTIEENIDQHIKDLDQQFKNLKQAITNHQMNYENKLQGLADEIASNKARQLKYYQKINFYRDLRSHLEEENLFKNSKANLENTISGALVNSIKFIQNLAQQDQVWAEYCSVLAEIGIECTEYPTEDFISRQVEKLMQTIMKLNSDNADAFAQHVFACIPNLSANQAHFVHKIAALIDQKNLVFNSRIRLGTIIPRINQRYFDNLVNPYKEIESVTKLIFRNELKIKQADEALNVLKTANHREEDLYEQFKNKVNSFYDLAAPPSDDLLFHFDQLSQFMRDAKSDLARCITRMKDTLSDLVKVREFLKNFDTTSAKHCARHQKLIDQKQRIQEQCNSLEKTQTNIELRSERRIALKHSQVIAEALLVPKYQEVINELDCFKQRYQKIYDNLSGKIIDIKSHNDELLVYENRRGPFVGDLQNIKQLLASCNYPTLWDDVSDNEYYFPQTKLIEITVKNPVIKQQLSSPLDDYLMTMPSTFDAPSLEDELKML